MALNKNPGACGYPSAGLRAGGVFVFDDATFPDKVVLLDKQVLGSD
jgi:hypothetical protein